MVQALLHFMPIKKTVADRKDNLTVYSSCSLKAETLFKERGECGAAWQCRKFMIIAEHVSSESHYLPKVTWRQMNQ